MKPTGERPTTVSETRPATVSETRPAAIIEQNIRTLLELRSRALETRSRQERISDAITDFSGRMPFLYLHAVWFGVWIALNLGAFGIRAFDPYPFGLLTMIVSLEAIFLSTFVLISQNRTSAEADHRADLDLQINLLTEHEITRVIRMLDAIGRKLEVGIAADPELEDLERNVSPQEVLDEMDLAQHRARRPGKRIE
jgi:uncharacterized membrane protein